MPIPSILFFDPECQQPYDTRTLRERAMGGTEATVVRIADALGAYVMQHNRTEAVGTYLAPTKMPGIDHVVLNRDARALPIVRDLFPNAKVYLWLHDHMRPRSKRERRFASMAAMMRDLSVTIICVSDTQRHGVEALLRQLRVADHVSARTIYNPVSDELAPNNTPVDMRKIVFFSSPNKGLAFAIDAFRAMRRRMPDLYLRVGNPGYQKSRPAEIDGVEWLDPLPQQQIHTEVRSALCTFAPNFVYPETFGLVFAESKALGTPILAHDYGAAAEVIGDQKQILPLPHTVRVYESVVHKLSIGRRGSPARLADRLGLFDAYADRIDAWRCGARPVVTPDPRFRLAAVADKWRALFMLA